MLWVGIGWGQSLLDRIFPYKNEHFSKVSFYKADTGRLKICLFYFLAFTCGDYFITKKAGPFLTLPVQDI